ncbi:MAG: hypothetical protein HYY35_11540 [Deltaproteobacteria bacterium]|nr:hypothetical protein [Deltaproteobacteria bacterium]
MVSISELSRMEGILRRGGQTGGDSRLCREYLGKIRMWLAVGRVPADVRRRLEMLLSRFGNVRY